MIATRRRVDLLNVIHISNQDMTPAAPAPDNNVTGHPPARLTEKVIRNGAPNVYEIGVLVHAFGVLPNPQTKVALVNVPDQIERV